MKLAKTGTHELSTSVTEKRWQKNRIIQPFNLYMEALKWKQTLLGPVGLKLISSSV